MTSRRATRYIPWRDVYGWSCLRCGKCCREYLVPLTYGEVLRYSLIYGPVVVRFKNKYYLLRKPDGSCYFLIDRGGITECSIYYDRPIVCRLYPFYITEKPIEGLDEKKALHKTPSGKKVYVYLDIECPGLNRARNIHFLIRKVVEVWMRYKRALEIRV